MAAESYIQAGAAHYALSRFDEAVKMAERAVRLRPDEGKHHFYLAKYQARVGNGVTAVEHLEKSVGLVPEMALAAVADFDLNRSEGVLDVLNRMDTRVMSALQSKLTVLQGWPQMDVKAQEVRDLLVAAEKALNDGDFVQRALTLRTANSCVERLPFAGQLAELANLGVSFNATLAESLLRQDKREEVEQLWVERSKELVVSNPKLAKLAAKSEPTWLELILLVTAEEAQHFCKPGSQRWEVPVAGRMSCAIGLDGTVCIGEYRGRVLALAPASGKTLWELAIKAHLTFVAIGPGGALFVGTSGRSDSHRHLEVFPKLYALDVLTGQELWDFEAGALEVTKAVIGADGTVYVGLAPSSYVQGSDREQSCVVAAFEGRSGAKRWSTPLPFDLLNGMAIGSAGTIYVNASRHRQGCKVFALDGRSGASRWNVEVKQASVVAGLALGGDDTLYCIFSDWDSTINCVITAHGFVAIDGRDGREIWRFNARREGG